MKLRITTSIALVVSTIALSACTPPMPPELKAQLADQNISCLPGDFNLASSVDLANLNGWLSEYNAICGANGTLVDPTLDPTVQIDAYITTEAMPTPPCTVTNSTPIALDGAVPAISVSGLESVILNSSVLFGILNGAITQWNDPFIAELNPDSELPATPIVVDSKVDPSVLKALSSWMKELDSTAWASAPALLTEGPAALATTTITSAPVDGTIGIYPYSFAANNSLGMVSIQGSEVVDANLESLASGTTQMRFLEAGKLGVPLYDSTIAPTSLQGDDQATTPWGAIYSTMLNICSGPNEKTVQAFARYATRLDAQGSLVDLNMTSLGETVRAQALDLLLAGLPEPSPMPSDIVIPDAPEPTDGATPEPTDQVVEEVTDEATPAPTS